MVGNGASTCVTALAGCGDGGSATDPSVETSPTRLIDGTEHIVIKTFAELQEMVDTGEILEGPLGAPRSVRGERSAAGTATPITGGSIRPSNVPTAP